MKYVDLETSRILKSLEFNEKCKNYYLVGISRATKEFTWKLINSNFSYTNVELDENFNDCTSMYTNIQRYSAPSYIEVIGWLREEHKIWVTILPKFSWNEVRYSFQIIKYDTNSPNCIGQGSTGIIGNFGEKEAYINSILTSLEIIKKSINR